MTPILKLRGSPREMGQAHGEAMRDKISALSQERISIILSDHPNISENELAEVANCILKQVKAIDQPMHTEAFWTAKSANIAPWRLLVAGAYSDITDVIGRQRRGTIGPDECTIIPIRLSTGGFGLLGTWDTHASALGSLIVVHRSPSSGTPTVALTTAGWPMQQGVTSAGLAFAIANLVAADASSGIPYIAALRKLTLARSATKASAAASRTPLCSARYFAFADKSGWFSAVETDGFRATVCEDPVPHTNHFLFPPMVEREGRPAIRARSEARRAAAIGLLDGITQGGVLDGLPALSHLSGVLQAGSGRSDRTGALFILDPGAGRISFVKDPVSHSNWEFANLDQT